MGMFRDPEADPGRKPIIRPIRHENCMKVMKIGPKAGEGYPIIYYVDPPVILVIAFSLNQSFII